MACALSGHFTPLAVHQWLSYNILRADQVPHLTCGCRPQEKPGCGCPLEPRYFFRTTQSSEAVSHPSTFQAQCCFTLRMMLPAWHDGHWPVFNIFSDVANLRRYSMERLDCNQITFNGELVYLRRPCQLADFTGPTALFVSASFFFPNLNHQHWVS